MHTFAGLSSRRSCRVGRWPPLSTRLRKIIGNPFLRLRDAICDVINFLGLSSEFVRRPDRRAIHHRVPDRSTRFFARKTHPSPPFLVLFLEIVVAFEPSELRSTCRVMKSINRETWQAEINHGGGERTVAEDRTCVRRTVSARDVKQSEPTWNDLESRPDNETREAGFRSAVCGSRQLCAISPVGIDRSIDRKN